jgi:hypothetical protein
MKKFICIICFLLSFWFLFAQKIPFDIMQLNKQNNNNEKFQKYDTKKFDKEYKIKEFVKALNQCDTNFLNSYYGSIFKDNSIDWLIQNKYDTLISIFDVNNDKLNDLVFSYCLACDENLLIIFLNIGDSYKLALQEGGCLAKIEFKNNILNRLTTFPCRCCNNPYRIFNDYILKDSINFLFSDIEYSIMQLDLPDKIIKPYEILLKDQKCIYPTCDYKKIDDTEYWELDSLGKRGKQIIRHYVDCLEKIPSGSKIKVLGLKDNSRFIIWEREKDKFVFGWIK